MTLARKGTVLGATLLASCAWFAEARAEYESGDEVTVLIGYQPGGGSDALAQLVHPYLSEILDISLVNEYRPGASGAIAWTQLAKRARADGHTISIVTTPTLVTNPMMNESIQYTLEEVELLANIVSDPGLIVVGSDSPFETAEELFEHARANPGELTVGNSGIGGDDHFSTLLFEEQSEIDVQPVPFEGDGPSWQAAMGGNVDVSFNNLGITFPQIEAGNLRPLALLAEERHPDLPDVPTMRELGFDVVSGSSRGYGAPAGLDEEQRQALIDGFAEVVENEDFLQDARDRAMVIDFKAGEEFKNYMLELRATYERLLERYRAEQQGQ
jgi:putative tricarboxylic transport membrane protein